MGLIWQSVPPAQRNNNGKIYYFDLNNIRQKIDGYWAVFIPLGQIENIFLSIKGKKGLEKYLNEIRGINE